jgi:hypothetical protein
METTISVPPPPSRKSEGLMTKTAGRISVKFPVNSMQSAAIISSYYLSFMLSRGIFGKQNLLACNQQYSSLADSDHGVSFNQQ